MSRGIILWRKIISVAVILIIVNVASSYFYKRFDLTEDGKYTFSETTLEAVKKVDSVMYIDVFLEGKLPPEFRKLQKETKQVLQEFSDTNPLIKFNFINPLERAKNTSKTLSDLVSMGLTPTNITIKQGASISQRILIPWALVNYKDRTIKVNLLKEMLGKTYKERVSESIRQLEYTFTTVILKILSKRKKSIAILRGNGEKREIYIANFLLGLKESYSIAPFTLDVVEKKSEKTLEELSRFDLAIMIKPTEAFSDKEKQVLDQYVMRGGRLLLMIDQVQADLDSLLVHKKYFAFPRKLNIEDMLFKYGVRINPVLVKDLSFTNIILARGTGPSATYHKVPWLYAPLVISEENHLINQHITPLRLNFANDIDTIANNIHKTILLNSSNSSKLMSTPREIRLEYVLQRPNKETFNNPKKSLAVLLEGEFSSVYENRIKPFPQTDFKTKSSPNRIIIITDGDVAVNQVDQGNPLMLGFDKWTNQLYGNKVFLMNCVNYLLEDTGLITVRTKVLKIPFLDEEKAYKEASYWKSINTLVPLVMLGIFWIMYFLIRRRRYAK